MNAEHGSCSASVMSPAQAEIISPHRQKFRRATFVIVRYEAVLSWRGVIQPRSASYAIAMILSTYSQGKVERKALNKTNWAL